MTSINNKYHKYLICFAFISVMTFSYGQRDTERFRMQFALGVNNPIDNGENDGYFSKTLNLPTVNLGFQYMFKSNLGAKLDFGFNRSKNADGSEEFKLNYSRVNAQIVYDFTDVLNFLPEPMSIQAHAGPGISFTKPLGNNSENKYTYLNILLGLELQYKISRTLAILGDFGYAKALSSKDNYDIEIDGFSFNGDLVYATFGLSVAISGCRYCN